MLVKRKAWNALRRQPSGYTLIELLVVIAIIGFLAGLLLLMWPGMKTAQLTTSNADKIQARLLIAKQRAIRDRVPTGVRLITQPGNTNHFSELVYIQQPDPLVPVDTTQKLWKFTANSNPTVNSGGMASWVPPPKNPPTTIDFFGGFAANNVTNHLVQPGDYLEVNGGGLLGKITQVAKTSLVVAPNSRNPNPPPAYIAPDLANKIDPVSGTMNWRIIRMPRILDGEEPLVLTGGIIIDNTPLIGTGPPANRKPLSVNLPSRSDGQTTNYEILFAPSGSVIGQGTLGNGQIILFVRDPYGDVQNQRDPNPAIRTSYYLYGNPVLIGIQTGTGLIGGYAVNVSGTDPYSETRDPHASGL